MYAFTQYNPVKRADFANGISESSGLVYTDGKLWTHNDGGNSAEFYAIDTNTGAILQTVIIDNAINTDWEDIAADQDYFYLADVGNNLGARTDLQILRIAKRAIGMNAISHVTASVIAFSYADQTSFTPSNFNNYDCEAMITFGDSLYLFTKNKANAQTKVYKMPKVPGTYSLSPYLQYNVGGLITGADYNTATREVILVGYFTSNNDSFLWLLGDFNADSFFNGNKRRINIANGGTWQTEGICWWPGNRFALSCEATPPTPSAFYIGDRKLGLPSAGVATASNIASIRLYPNPAQERITLNGLENKGPYRIINSKGQQVQTGSMQTKHSEIDIQTLPVGHYIIRLDNGDGQAAAVPFLKQ